MGGREGTRHGVTIEIRIQGLARSDGTMAGKERGREGVRVRGSVSRGLWRNSEWIGGRKSRAVRRTPTGKRRAGRGRRSCVGSEGEGVSR